MRVLVVEDERKVADALRDGLEAEQYEVVIERTGEGGLVRSTTEAFDVVVLDLGPVIDVHIARLRRKIDDDSANLIHTIRGVGFMVRSGDP